MNFTAFVGKQQPSALDKGEAFETRIISLDLTRETAAVKLGDKCRGGGSSTICRWCVGMTAGKPATNFGGHELQQAPRTNRGARLLTKG